MRRERKPSGIVLTLGLLAAFGTVVAFLLVTYRPDRPVATITPGSSSGPAFVAQIIRPRLGLPLGGLAPPQLFGLEAHLGFDSASPGAVIGTVAPGRVELAARGWDLVLLFDPGGRPSPEIGVAFEMVFEGRRERVRCRPAAAAVGSVLSSTAAGGGELSGSFDVELAHCEYAATGEPLGWPPRPLVLHGSFDRLPLRGGR